MNLKIKFVARKTGTKSFIYCRIRLDGTDATDFTTHIPQCKAWDQKNQLFLGKEFHFANQRLITITNDIMLLHSEMSCGSHFNAHDLRNKYIRRAENAHSLRRTPTT